MRRLLAGIAEDIAGDARLVGHIFSVLGEEIAELVVDTSRWRQCLMAALVVPLAITFSLLLDLDAVWWSGISAFMTVLTTGADSLRQGLIRIAATTVGVVGAVIVARWLPYNHLALTLFLALTAFLGTVGRAVSPHGTAWLLATVTANMVLLAGLNDPLAVPTIAFDRWSEVLVGVVASALVTNLIAPGGSIPPTPPPRGWGRLFDEDWPVALQGIRAAVAVVILLFVWLWLDLQDFQQMAITVAIVMAAPGPGDVGARSRDAVSERAVHRFVGCLVGGLAALGCLALSITDFLPWLLVIAAAMWICMHVRSSRRGVSYVGIQAAVAFIVTMVQGRGPPESLLPGLERFAGITGGLLVLMVVSLALWPHLDDRHGQTEPAG